MLYIEPVIQINQARAIDNCSGCNLFDAWLLSNNALFNCLISYPIGRGIFECALASRIAYIITVIPFTRITFNLQSCITKYIAPQSASRIVPSATTRSASTPLVSLTSTLLYFAAY